MNPEQLESLFSNASTVKLDEKKKDAIHREILHFVKNNPLKGKPKAWCDFSRMPLIQFKTASIALAGVLLFAALGVTIAHADAALPGDILYPFKIGFNEKIEEVLASSDQAKLTLNIQLAQLRLEEAEQLAVKGTLNSGNELELSGNFTSHLNQAAQYIATLNAKKMYQATALVSANFDASLKAHAVIISGLKKNANSGATLPLIATVQAAATQFSANSSITTSNAASNNTEATVPDARQRKVIQEKISSIESAITAIKASINNNKNAIGSAGATQSENNLNLAQQKVDEGKAGISQNQNNYQQSISSLQQASSIAQESQDLINDTAHLGVSVPISINAESDAGSHTNQPINANGKVDNSLNSNTPNNILK